MELTISGELEERIRSEIFEKYMFFYPDNDPRFSMDQWIYGYPGRKTGYIGYCTACHQWTRLDIKKPVHRSYDYCSCCYEPVMLYKGWVGRKGLKQRHFVRAWKMIDRDHIEVRELWADTDDYTDFEINGAPKREVFIPLRFSELSPGKHDSWRWTLDSFKLEYVPVKMKKAAMCPYGTAGGGQYNFGYCTREMHDLDFQELYGTFVGWIIDSLDQTSFSCGDAVAAAARDTMCELLYKAGFGQIAMDRCVTHSASRRLNFRAKSPKKFLRGVSQDVNQKVMQTLREFDDWHISGSVRGVERITELYMARPELKPSLIAPDVRYLELLERLTMYSSQKIYNYYNRLDCDPVMYCDYLSMLGKQGIPLTEEAAVFPRSAHEAHDRLVDRVKTEADRTQNENIAKRAKKIRSGGFTDYEKFGLTVIVPETAADIITEGECMSNCVAGYVKKHSKGVTTILFVRKADKPSLSYFTLEISPGNASEALERFVVQCYGYKNLKSYKNDPQVLRFLCAFQRHVRWCLNNKKLAKKYHGKELRKWKKTEKKTA